MAMIDYGAIAFKNGKLFSKDFFDDMQDMVGWEDTEQDVDSFTKEPINLKGNYFTFVGDRNNTVCFYKGQIMIVERLNSKEIITRHEYLNDNSFTWSKWSSYIGGNEATIKHKNGYYVFKWKYKDNKYKVYFGYGVDLPAYKKWHIVNYYKSLPYFISKIKNKIKYGW